MKIESRQMKILILLLEGHTIQGIAEKLNISSRTIYRDIHKINQWLISRKIIDKHDSGFGVDSVLDENIKDEIFRELDNKNIETKYSLEERVLIIITELVLAKEPLKIYYLSRKLKVTEATISADLDKVENWLNEYKISLIRKQGFGIEIVGREDNLRECILSILYKGIELYDIKKIFRNISLEDSVNKVQLNVQNRLLGLVDLDMIQSVEKTIKNMESELENKLTDDAYTGLLMHIVLAITRLKNGDVIKVPQQVLDELSKTNEYAIAISARKELEKEFEIDIPEDEIAYITMYLRGAKLASHDYDTEDFMYMKFDVLQITKDMIKIAEENLKLSLINDREFLMGLLIHLKPVISRLKLNMRIRNPLLQMIQSQYENIYDISKKMCKIIEEELQCDVPDEEIGFIALHLGAAVERKNINFKRKYKVLVVCPSGLGASKMLTTKLIKELNILDVVATASVLDIPRFMKKHEDIDLIISTVEIFETSYDYVKVNPLLLEKDIVNIQNQLYRIEQSTDYKVTQKSPTESIFDMNTLKEYIQIADLINEKFFVKELTVSNQEDAISKISKDIHTGNSIKEKKLFENLTKRNNLMGTAIPKTGMALVHCESSTINAFEVGLYRLSNTIPFDSMSGDREPVDLIMLMIIKEQASIYYREMLSVLSYAIIEDNEFVTQLRQYDRSSISEILSLKYKIFIKEYINNSKKL